jgi:class 3 adenylate cyclase
MTREGAVMDIIVWLRSLGLEKYEAAFRENEIDETVPQDLTAEGLKELWRNGARSAFKLPSAIAAMRDDSRGKWSTSDRAERRQVTVMFSDLVGSTRLFRRAWTPKTSARSFRFIRSVVPETASSSIQ